MPNYIAVGLFLDPSFHLRTDFLHFKLPDPKLDELLFDEGKGVWCTRENGMGRVDFHMVGEIQEPKGEHHIISIIERGNNTHIDAVLAFVARKLEERLNEIKSELQFFEPRLFPFSDDRVSKLKASETPPVALLKSGENKPST